MNMPNLASRHQFILASFCAWVSANCPIIVAPPIAIAITPDKPIIRHLQPQTEVTPQPRDLSAMQ